MNQVITALIIALSFILIFFWAPILGVVYSGSLESTHPLVMSDNSVNAGYVTGYSAEIWVKSVISTSVIRSLKPT